MDQVIEQIYEAALNTGEWNEVTERLNKIFVSQTSALYSLNCQEFFSKPINVSGVEDSYLSDFRGLYFTIDNPWLMSEPLHKPGIIRTDTHLSQYLKDSKILRNSTYYNEWLKPQKLNHSLGCTLSVQHNVKTNLTLFRSSEEGAYSKTDIAKFSQICRHTFRAIHAAKKMQSLQLTVQLANETMQQLSCAAFVLNDFGTVININEMGMALLNKQKFLSVSNNQLSLSDKTLDDGLKKFILSASHSIDQNKEFLYKPDKQNIIFSISLIDFCTRPSSFISAESIPTKLLLIKEKFADFQSQVHQYGFTPSETKLAKCLYSGLSLKESAKTSKISYETTRSYLKILFQKTNTHRQIDLVRLLIGNN